MPVTRQHNTFAKPGGDPRLVERVQGINVETGRLKVGEAGKEFFVPEQPANVLCYIAGDDFALPAGCEPDGEVGIAVSNDMCLAYGNIRLVEEVANLEFDIPSETIPMFDVTRGFVLSTPSGAPKWVTDVADDFSVNHLTDPEWYITMYGADAVVSGGIVYGDWLGLLVNSQKALASRNTVKFRRTGPGGLDVVASVRSQWKPEVLYDWNLWGIWGRCYAGGINMVAWADEDATKSPARSAIAAHSSVAGVDYWVRITVDDALNSTVELFNTDPAGGTPVASLTHDFATDIAAYPKTENLRAPGQGGVYNQSYSPNVYLDSVVYEVQKVDEVNSVGILSIDEFGKLSVMRVDGQAMDDNSLIRLGQLQYIRK